MDGRILGIVTKSLERQREESDINEPLPFFSAIPSKVIQLVFNELTKGTNLPWEDYQ
jgi:hypothetical protein